MYERSAQRPMIVKPRDLIQRRPINDSGATTPDQGLNYPKHVRDHNYGMHLLYLHVYQCTKTTVEESSFTPCAVFRQEDTLYTV